MPADGTKKYEKTFDIILSSVDESQLEALAPQMAKAFSLEPDAAHSILRSSPIVFLAGVGKSDVRTIKKHLLEISKHGAEFTITTQAAQALPKVVWAQQPKFGEAASGELVHQLRFDVGMNAFVCPGCGETFLFRRVGNLAKKLTSSTVTTPMVEEPAKPAAPAPAAKAAPASAKPSAKAAPPPADEPLEAVVPLESIEMLEKGGVEEADEMPTPAPLGKKGGRPAPPPPAKGRAKPAEEEVEEAEELAEVEEVEEAEELEAAVELSTDELSDDMDLSGGEEEEAEELAEVAEEEEAEESEEAEEAEELAEVEEVEEEAEEIESLEEAEEEEEEEEAPRAPAKGGRGGSSVKEKPSIEKAPAKAPSKISYMKPAAKAEPEEEEESDEEGGDDVQFSVFLSRIPTPDKQNQAAKLISEIRGVSVQEAKELASRMVIPVLKDVSKDEAEKCLDKFKKIKISGRMTKKK